MGWQDAPEVAVSQSIQPAWATAPEVGTESSSALDMAKEAGSAFVRPIIKAVSGIPLMAMDAGVAMRNLVTGNYDPSSLHSLLFGSPKNTGATELPSTTFNQALDQYTRAPATGAGKVAEFINTALAGAALPTPKISNPAPAEFTNAPATSALTGAQQRALQQGEDLGMRATPGQAIGSKPLQQIEANLESHPWTSGPINAVRSGNQAVLDRTAAQAIGENSPSVDATVLGRASERLGNIFESVRNPAQKLIIDPKETQGVLSKIDSNFEGLLPNNESILDNKLVNRLASLTDEGSVNAQQLGSLSSKLGKAAYKQMSSPMGDRDLGQALYAVKDHVDDLVQRTLTGEESSLYTSARQQYRTLMQITSRVGTVNPSTGHVSGATLANVLQRGDRQGFLYGGNESPLYNAARFAQAFKPIVGDSGTATRSANLFNPVELALGIPANLATRAYLSAPSSRLLQIGSNAATQLPQAIPPSVLGGLIAAQTSEAGQ